MLNCQSLVFLRHAYSRIEESLPYLDHSIGFRTNQRVFFLASANLSPCHKTMEENPIYLPEPGASDLPVSRKALIFDETIEQVMQ